MYILQFIQALTIILSPLYILRFKIALPFLPLPFPITFLEVAILLSFASSLVVFLKNGADFKKIQTRLDPYILFFLAAASLSVFFSYDFIGGLGILKAYFIEPILFYYSLVFVARQKGYSYIITSLFMVGIWVSLLSLVQKFTGQLSLAPNEIAQGRVTALYNSANSLALFLGPIILLSVALFVEAKKNLAKLVYFCIFIFFTLTMIWTKSRGGLIAEILSLVIFMYTVFALRINILKKIWYVIPVSVVLLSTLFFYQIYQDYKFIPPSYGRPYTDGDTLQIRFFIWAGTVNLLKDHPIIGAGLNGFKTLYSNQYRLPQYQEQFQYPHNLVLTYWVETGIIGLSSFLLLVVCCYSLVIRNILKSNKQILGAGLLAGLSYWMIHGVVDVPYFKNDLSFEFWVFLSLVILWVEIKENS